MRAVSHTASFALDHDVDRVFPLFSPEAEREWEPGWDYQNLMGHTELHEDYMALSEVGARFVASSTTRPGARSSGSGSRCSTPISLAASASHARPSRVPRTRRLGTQPGEVIFLGSTQRRNSSALT